MRPCPGCQIEIPDRATTCASCGWRSPDAPPPPPPVDHKVLPVLKDVSVATARHCGCLLLVWAIMGAAGWSAGVLLGFPAAGAVVGVVAGYFLARVVLELMAFH